MPKKGDIFYSDIEILKKRNIDKGISYYNIEIHKNVKHYIFLLERTDRKYQVKLILSDGTELYENRKMYPEDLISLVDKNILIINRYLKEKWNI